MAFSFIPNWLPGPANKNPIKDHYFEDGGTYIMAVELEDRIDYTVVNAGFDSDEGWYFEEADDETPWGWTWDDVTWYTHLKHIEIE